LEKNEMTIAGFENFENKLSLKLTIKKYDWVLLRIPCKSLLMLASNTLTIINSITKTV
jgi:hypothetical protein